MIGAEILGDGFSGSSEFKFFPAKKFPMFSSSTTLLRIPIIAPIPQNKFERKKGRKK